MGSWAGAAIEVRALMRVRAGVCVCVKQGGSTCMHKHTLLRAHATHLLL